MGRVVLLETHTPRPKEVKERIIGYRMSFYSEEELELGLLSLNMFGWEKKRYTRLTLKGIDPLFIKDCLIKMKRLSFISNSGKDVINSIVSNIEEIYHEKTIG